MNDAPPIRPPLSPDVDLSYITEDLRALAVPISSLQFDPHNAKKNHGMDALAESFAAYKQRKPVVVNRASGNTLEAGEGSMRTMMQLGYTHIAAVFVEDDAETAVGYALADNRTAELSEWDDAMLADLLVALPPEVPTGFDDESLANIFAEAGFDGADYEEPADAEPETSRADALRDEWGVETGQVWILPSRTAGQEHRLICGDCTETAVVERVMGGAKATVVFTDPPYGVCIGKKNVMLNSFQKAGRNLTDIVSDDLSPEELKPILTSAFKLVKTIMADDCSVFVTAPQNGEIGMMMMMMMNDAGLQVRHVLTWIKSSATFSMGKLDYDYKHEPILFTWGKRHRKNKGDGFINSCWEIAKPRASAEHPTMKPPELYEQAYANHSDIGDLVYEPFSGSGTAFIAAENLARQCRAIEISPAYVAVALQRYKDAFGVTPHLQEQA